MKNADASPTKDFFVRMITKDISLEDCILDLIDNCLDGVRRRVGIRDDHRSSDSYRGFQTVLEVGPEEFRIEDNCGGISIADAIDYAFHFGRRSDAPADGDFPIGLYGIGMKRAILKIGRVIDIHSSTNDEAFLCKISVEEWLKNDLWEFEMDDAKLIEGAGTDIRIRDLYKDISDEFDGTAFINRLIRITARDYARFIEKGFKIIINGTEVKGRQYAVKISEEFKPYRKTYCDEGVKVDILAGMAALPPDDNDPDERASTEYGWFVFCNDRVVLASDKTECTVWGNEGFTRWHQQYNGFMGMVLFHGSDPNLLPWNTTKRGIDESSPLYRRAVKEMKIATQPWTEYTHQRKSDLEKAKQNERRALPKPFFEIDRNLVFKVPKFSSRPSIRMANIQYRKSREDVIRAAGKLGNKNMSFKDVGMKTFEYFMENEAEEEE